jgi:uncharacterized protein (UPF0297 family)
MENTTLFDVKAMKEHLIKETLLEVTESLKERGYNASNQLVGYLISGDPGFISNYQEARDKIQELDRSEIIKFLLENYLEK